MDDVGIALHRVIVESSLQRRVACLFASRAQHRVLHEDWLGCVRVLSERARGTPTTDELAIVAAWVAHSVITALALLLGLNGYQVASFLLAVWPAVEHVERTVRTVLDRSGRVVSLKQASAVSVRRRAVLVTDTHRTIARVLHSSVVNTRGAYGFAPVRLLALGHPHVLLSNHPSRPVDYAD